jgi:hypothetical protein
LPLATPQSERINISELRTLYPEIEPFNTGRLQVSPVHELYDHEPYRHELYGHELYYEQCGNPEGKPVVFLHGGPGAGLVPDYLPFFDPNAFRMILFDQCGAGKSTRHASLENTLPGTSSPIASRYASNLAQSGDWYLAAPGAAPPYLQWFS